MLHGSLNFSTWDILKHSCTSLNYANTAAELKLMVTGTPLGIETYFSRVAAQATKITEL